MIINGRRALAYVVTIDEIKPIEGYDRVEYARTNGWWVIIGKNDNLQVGDKCVYFEVDSKVNAEDERFAFLEKRNYKIKTQKMCKVISQGLLMPLSVFPEISDADVNTDVTETLKVAYAVEEDNARKGKVNPDAKYKSMAARHQKIFKQKWARWLMRRSWGKKLMFMFFGKKKDSPRTFPTHFPFVHKTDEERCLIAQTKIMTNHGVKSIADIVNNRLPVKVLSMNPDGTLSYKRILDYQKFDNPGGDVVTIEYPYAVGVSRLNHLCCTKDHRIFTNRGYVTAENIKIGDLVYSPTDAYEDSCLASIYGMLLGDSHIYQDKRTGGLLRVVATNGEDQLPYLEYKKSLFGEGSICDAGLGSLGNTKHTYHWNLPVDPYIDMNLKNDFFINGKKTITDNVLNKITEESLAFWYMDDGCLSYRDGYSQSPSIRINTQGFSKDVNDKLVNLLVNKFGISCHATKETKNNKEYFHIYIDVNGTPKFLAMVTPYMCRSMAYKTLPTYENLLETKKRTYKRVNRVLPCEVLNIYNEQHKNKSLPKKFNVVYDIEVEENHNFIADGIVTHNCENIPWVLGYERPLIVTEKLDGTSSTYILERKKQHKYEFYVLSRNVRQADEKQECYHDHNIYWDMAFKYDIERHLKEYLENNPDCPYVCIQGESVGSVQGNPLKLPEDDLYCFNFIDGRTGRTDSLTGKNIVEQWEMKWVPILDEHYMVPNDMEEFKQFATAKSVVNPNVLREGIVLRDPTNDFSFKNVSREYLLKHNE